MIVSGIILLDTMDMEWNIYPYSCNYEPNIVPLVENSQLIITCM